MNDHSVLFKDDIDLHHKTHATRDFTPTHSPSYVLFQLCYKRWSNEKRASSHAVLV